ncbi:MAG: 6-bladed beta-propeller [Candidatus Poribacteria bacterium]|nr:6-bladed beta-propeller [Candidatus Poribacteria bacterium]
MKKSIALLFMTYALFVWRADETRAVSFLKFEQEFSGKGSTNGFFSKNSHVAFDAEGNIYVSDADNRLVQKLSPTGEFIMQIPKEKTVDNILKKPGDIAADGDGNIYVADITAHHIEETADPKIYMFAPCVYKFSASGELMHTYFVDAVDVRPKQVLPARLIIDEEGKTAFGVQPKGHDRELLVDVDSQNQLYVLDRKRSTVHKFDADGKRLIDFGRYGAGNGEFDRDASDIEIDIEGNVLIADTGNHRVVKFNAEGRFMLSFGKKGRGDGEFTKPLAIAALATGEILVKDSSQFKRFLGSPLAFVIDVVSPSGQGVTDLYSTGTELADSVLDSVRSRSSPFSFDPTQQSDLDALHRRIRLLEEVEYRRYYSDYYDDDDDKDENQKEEDEDLKARAIRETIYHNVIARVQRFDRSGRYSGRVIYEVDKTSADEHDLAFLTLDSLGHIYLRDGSDLTIRQYSIEGFTIKPSHMNALYNTRVINVDSDFTEDYEDIDENADVQDELNQFRLSNSFLLTYNLSERWNLTFADVLTYVEQDERYITPPKLEDSYDFETQALTNTVAANLKFITNPNPYRYKELNLYAERIDGTTNLNQNAIFQDVNQQAQEGEGDASSFAVGMNWDVLTKVNLWLEYSDLNPAQTSRNFVRRFTDVDGNLFEVFGSRNEAKQFLGELTIKF